MSALVSISHHPTLPETPANFGNDSLLPIKEMVQECLGRIDDLDSLVQGKSILIKPNLVRPDLQNLPASTTDPRVKIGRASCRERV